jgi:hypothetical protein
MHSRQYVQAPPRHLEKFMKTSDRLFVAAGLLWTTIVAWTGSHMVAAEKVDPDKVAELWLIPIFLVYGIACAIKRFD